MSKILGAVHINGNKHGNVESVLNNNIISFSLDIFCSNLILLTSNMMNFIN